MFEGARDDVRDRRIFSPYDVQRVLNYFDGAISFVSVFLYEELVSAICISAVIMYVYLSL